MRIGWETLKLLAAMALLGGSGFAAPSNMVPALVNGNTEFAWRLYGQLNTREGNLFLSPYSVSTCLAMAYDGARGDTQLQMSRALRFYVPQDILPPAFGDLQTHLNDLRQKSGIDLDVANALWADKGHHFLAAFLHDARDRYGASVNQADFRTEAETARKRINQWVLEKTHNKIADILPAGTVDGSTRLVLVNAIYFKGKWQQPFKTNLTETAPFHAASRETQARLMHQEADFGYAESDGLQVLDLPYAGNSLSMLVLLPRDTNGLGALESRLNSTNLQQWVGTLHRRKVNVYLPRFRLTSEFSLKDPLAQLGMPVAFTPQADFSGMDGARDLLISAVLHKAFVDVNEEGTEAAAATGTVVALTAIQRPWPVPVFRADHPFLFLIRDRQTGSVLFLGRLSSPT